MPNNLRYSRIATRVSVYLLLVLYTLGLFINGLHTWILWLIPCLTVAAFLPGIHADHARTCDWLCFVILLHFTVGVSNAMAPNGDWRDIVQVFLSVAIFISAMFNSRWLKAWQYERSQATTDDAHSAT